MSATLLQTVTIPAGGLTSIDFTNIPQTFTDLMVVLSVRNTGTYEHVKISVNGAATSISGRYLNSGGSGSTPGSGVYAQYMGNATRDAYTANTFSNTMVYITDYSSATSHKSISSESAAENNTGTANLTSIVIAANVYASNTPITSLSFFNESVSNLNQYSSASLYGINKITPTGSGATPAAEYLVVAGGGGGGWNWGGGGGAGGLVTSTYSVSPSTQYSITVGSGGAGASSSAAATQGGNSSVFGITAIGGGYGGRGGTNPSAGGNGGSGGGGGSSDYAGSYAGGTGTAGQGTAGASSTTTGTGHEQRGGGGGGFSAAGSIGTSNGGNGGNGLVTTFIGASVGYAGGGGGGAYTGFGVGGTAGIGGGANGGTSLNESFNAVAGSGGGGGGEAGGGGGNGGSGGSGVVVIRYPDIYANPTATTGNPMVNYANGYKIYTWTASGSITF